MCIKGLHQTVEKSVYELFEQKTQNTVEKLEAVWNTSQILEKSNTYSNQLLIFYSAVFH